MWSPVLFGGRLQRSVGAIPGVIGCCPKVSPEQCLHQGRARTAGWIRKRDRGMEGIAPSPRPVVVGRCVEVWTIRVLMWLQVTVGLDADQREMQCQSLAAMN